MPEEHKGRISIAVAVERTDWNQYAGQASYVKRRGERRRRRLQAGTALATTAAVIAVAVVANAMTKKSDASPAAKTSMSDYPTFPAKLPAKPILFTGRDLLQSGVIGAGAVAGHQWQIAYRIVRSGSAANGQPQANAVDVTLDGQTITIDGGSGAQLSSQSYTALNDRFEAGWNRTTNPMVVAFGSPSPGVTSVDLVWKNGTVVQVPIYSATGTRFASFAWDPANPPEALEQVGTSGVQKIAITYDGGESWNPGGMDSGKVPSPIQSTPPAVTTPTSTPNLSQTPQGVTRLSSGVLGEGTVAGRRWQLAYEIIPSGSAENDSNEVLCTDTTVDATTTKGICTSSKPFTSRLRFDYSVRQQVPLVVAYGAGEPGTTSMGLEWADGTKAVNAMRDVEGNPMAALAFDPAQPPAYLLEFGSYGEYRIPLTNLTRYKWTFTWPN